MVNRNKNPQDIDVNKCNLPLCHEQVQFKVTIEFLTPTFITVSTFRYAVRLLTTRRAWKLFDVHIAADLS
jgi:hypothetical protein